MTARNARWIASAAAVVLAATGCNTEDPFQPFQQSRLSVSAGNGHTCALSTDGTAYCWGSNRYGQLGIGSVDTLPHSTPLKVPGLPRMGAIAAGDQHTCGLSTSGTAYCWGNGGHGRLGNGDTLRHEDPTLVAGELSFTSISAGTHTCAIALGGVGYCWGNGVFGQLGNGGTTLKTVPTAISGGLSFTSLSAGESHACGTAAGVAYCWGYNAHGALGSGMATVTYTVPTAVSGALAFSSVSAGFRYTCATAAAAPPRCWGLNLWGELGAATPNSCLGFSDDFLPCSLTPLAVEDAPTMTRVAVSLQHTCGLTSAGDMYCWGANTSGQIGDGTVTAQPLAAGKVAGTLLFEQVSVGGSHTCGTTRIFEIHCWGGNLAGQVGDGSTSEQHLPVRVTLP